MGNHASNAKVGKIILPRGEVRSFNEPLNVAEVMLETPNFFVADTRSLQIGRRLSALKADADLCIGGVYVLLPMKRLNSVISAADLLQAAKKKKNKSKATVVPEVKFAATVEELGISNRRPMCRSKKPALETIVEENTF
ncbi:hypothetical protein V2J09_003431 [Rumex salicifolius]